jgi:hypothetical protein
LRTAALAAAALVLTSWGLAACGSATGTSGAGAAPPAAVAAAKSAVQKATAMSSTIPVTDPLPSAPPTGKTVLFLQCEQAECGEEGAGIKAAAAAIGWNVKVLNFQAANPATLVTALRNGLQYHPVAAFFSGVPQEAWQSMQQPYADAGAIIVDNYIDVAPTGSGVEAGRGYGESKAPMGEVLAEEQIADSGGAPAKSLLVNAPSYPVFKPFAQSYKAKIAKECPGCQVTEVDVTLPQLLGGQLVPAVVSAAKRISGLKYIVSVNGQFIGQLPQALQAAGLGGKFKITSGSGVSVDQQNVLNGTALATVSSPLILGGWQNVDEAIRHVMHLPIPAGDHTVPWVLLTKSNIGTPRDSYDRPTDYALQFRKLWHVG